MPCVPEFGGDCCEAIVDQAKVDDAVQLATDFPRCIRKPEMLAVLTLKVLLTDVQQARDFLRDVALPDREELLAIKGVGIIYTLPPLDLPTIDSQSDRHAVAAP